MITDFWNSLPRIAHWTMIAVPLIIILGMILSSIIDVATKTAVIQITVAPVSSTIKINNKIYKNGTYKVAPKTYNAVISKDGFNDYKETFSLKKGETKKIMVALEQSNGKNDWYDNNQDDEMIREGIGDIKYDEAASEFSKENPIAEKIPYDSTYWSINYMTDPGNNSKIITLIITLNMQEPSPNRPNNVALANGYKAEALAKIREWGFNPDDFYISYRYR